MVSNIIAFNKTISNLKIRLQFTACDIRKGNNKRSEPVCNAPRWRLPAGWGAPGWSPPRSSAPVSPALSSPCPGYGPDAAFAPRAYSFLRSWVARSPWSHWYRQLFLHCNETVRKTFIHSVYITGATRHDPSPSYVFNTPILYKIHFQLHWLSVQFQGQQTREKKTPGRRHYTSLKGKALSPTPFPGPTRLVKLLH